MTRKEVVNGFYAQYDGAGRLESDKQGEVEYIVTMNYIHRYLKPGMKVAEIGAGTGRYSVALAKEGYDVTAVEYTRCNYEQLVANAKGIDNIRCFQGDAVHLGEISDDSVDVTLLLGPMYHLYEEEEQLAALREAQRITKPGGTILIAYLSIYAIMYTNYLKNNFAHGFEENFTEDCGFKHFPEQLFTGFTMEEFEKLVGKTTMTIEKSVAVDGMLELAQHRADFGLEGEDFQKFLKYHLHFCEQRELLGLSSHILMICKNTK